MAKRRDYQSFKEENLDNFLPPPREGPRGGEIPDTFRFSAEDLDTSDGVGLEEIPGKMTLVGKSSKPSKKRRKKPKNSLADLKKGATKYALSEPDDLRDKLSVIQGGSPIVDELPPRESHDWTANVAKELHPLGRPGASIAGAALAGATLPFTGPSMAANALLGAAGGTGGTLAFNPDASLGEIGMGAALGGVGSVILPPVVGALGRGIGRTLGTNAARTGQLGDDLIRESLMARNARPNVPSDTLVFNSADDLIQNQPVMLHQRPPIDELQQAPSLGQVHTARMRPPPKTMDVSPSMLDEGLTGGEGNWALGTQGINELRQAPGNVPTGSAIDDILQRRGSGNTAGGYDPTYVPAATQVDDTLQSFGGDTNIEPMFAGSGTGRARQQTPSPVPQNAAEFNALDDATRLSQLTGTAPQGMVGQTPTSPSIRPQTQPPPTNPLLDPRNDSGVLPWVPQARGWVDIPQKLRSIGKVGQARQSWDAFADPDAFAARFSDPVPAMPGPQPNVMPAPSNVEFLGNQGQYSGMFAPKPTPQMDALKQQELGELIRQLKAALAGIE